MCIRNSLGLYALAWEEFASLCLNEWLHARMRVFCVSCPRTCVLSNNKCMNAVRHTVPIPQDRSSVRQLQKNAAEFLGGFRRERGVEKLALLTSKTKRQKYIRDFDGYTLLSVFHD